MREFTNSPLINHTRISPHRNSPRNRPITKLTIHHTAGNIGLENLGEWLSRPTTRASYNYGISSDGRVGMFVEERDRCWASSSPANDHQAVVIGVANSTLAPEWRVDDRAYESLINLCVDICRRNGIAELVYDGTPDGSLTRHNMFSRQTCPGPFLQSRFLEICALVNAQLGNTQAARPTTPATPTPTPAENGAYTLHVPLPGHTTAADAMAGTNPRNTQQPGEYSVFRVHGQAVNITRRAGSPGSWINGALNTQPGAAAPPEQNFTVSDENLDAMVTLGVVNSPSYWRRVANIEHLDALLSAAAFPGRLDSRIYNGVTTTEDALDVLRDAGIITNADYWKGLLRRDDVSRWLGQLLINIANRSRDVLERIIWAEARGEDLRGQVLVGNVIMNRSRARNFPDGIRAVVFANGVNSQGVRVYQFSLVSNGSYARATPTATQRQAVDQILDGVDHSDGATFFRSTRGLEGSWHETALHHLLTHGGHAFFREH